MPLNRLLPVSVPKILTLFIPEILSHPAIAGRDKTLSVPPVGKPVGRREEDLGMLKRHEVEILLKAGHAQTEVARLVGYPPRRTLRENPSSQPGRDLASKYKTAQNFRNWWLRISGTHRVLGRFGGNGPKSHGRIARSSQK